MCGSGCGCGCGCVHGEWLEFLVLEQGVTVRLFASLSCPAGEQHVWQYDHGSILDVELPTAGPATVQIRKCTCGRRWAGGVIRLPPAPAAASGMRIPGVRRRGAATGAGDRARPLETFALTGYARAFPRQFAKIIGQTRGLLQATRALLDF
jgi:hypothetical protein